MLADLIRRPTRDVGNSISINDYVQLWEQFGFNGLNYTVPSRTIADVTALEGVRNPIILAALILRAACLSEIEFAYQALDHEQGGKKLSYGPRLERLRKPWATADAGELITRMEFDASPYGNAYYWPSDSETLTWLDPMKMHVYTGDVLGPDGHSVVGKKLLAYQMIAKDGQPEGTFLPGEIIHYKPIPNPREPFLGMSWLTGLLPDLTADREMTVYKKSFLGNAATPQLVVKMNTPVTEEAFKQFKERFEAEHSGAGQAFKTLYLGMGADVQAVGANFKDLMIDGVQSKGETRLAVASGVPAPLLGIAEGLEGSSLNTGNYSAVRRRFSDMTIRPLWKKMCSALEVVAKPQPGQKLWYDDTDIAFLKADVQDQANIRQADSQTITKFVDTGFTPESSVRAVVTNDLSQLEHSGRLSVQLQSIEGDQPTTEDPINANAA